MGLNRGVALAALAALAVARAEAAPTPAEAARFLTQASFGPTTAEISTVASQGYQSWLDNQFSQNASLHRPQLEPPDFAGTATQAERQEVWWRYAVTAPDQLRQRVAFALSETMVVSDVNDQLHSQPLLLAEYYDTLTRDAFANYRTLLQNVTLAPAMGVYLSMIRNDKPDAKSGRRPDENYAREIMQLFSIGLWQLNPDGTPRLGAGGNRIPTYSQQTIGNFARVFTGWGWADASQFYATGTSYQPMKAFEDHHDTGAKTLLDGAQVPAGQTAAQDLNSALDNIFNHPNVGPFIARRLIQRLVTSNPSGAYVQRIAAVFNNNGTGVRGDLKAVVSALLLDPEARGAPAGSAGKLREPLLRLSAVWRAFGAAAANGKYKYDYPERDWGQAALRAPSVFNFFQPDFSAAGAVSAAGLYSPEFQIQTESQSVSMVNAFTRFVRNQSACRGTLPDTDASTIKLDICAAAARATDPANLLDDLNQLLLSGRMSAPMRAALLEYLNSLPAGDGTQRARDAIFLISASPEFAVQK